MQNIPSVSSIVLYNQILKNYCFPYLSFCDAEDDYITLEKNKVSKTTIIKCMRSIIFYIEVNVLYPRILKGIEKIISEGYLLYSDINYVFDKSNIIDYQKFKAEISDNSEEIIKYKYNVFYNSLINQYKKKLKEIRKDVKVNKNVSLSGGGKWKEVKNVDISRLSLYEKILYYVMVYLKPESVSSILNIYLVDPKIDNSLLIQERLTVDYKNYFDVSNFSFTIYKSHKGNISKKTYNFNDQNFNSLITDYIKEYNIICNSRLFGVISTNKFNKTIKNIFNCSFSYFKNSYKN